MPSFYTEVTCLLGASAVLGYLSFRLRLVPILGFLATGVILNAAGLVRNPELVEALAEVGVILLLFTIGIEFSIENLMRIRRLIFLGGGLQVLGTIGVVFGILMFLNVSWQAALFTGMLVSLSSTVIVLKLLESREETRTEAGQLSVGMLIFQDLAVVAMVIAVPLLGSAGTEGGLKAQLFPLGVAVVGIAVVLVIARRLVPKVLEALARTCSQEIFLLGVIAICLGTAFLTGLAGVSLSLGAFLAGLLVSESRFGSQALGEILPLQILFSATFFVSVGLLLDVSFLIRNIGLVLGVVAVVLLLKGIIVGLSARALGVSGGAAIAGSFLLAQVGEFSFVLERAGRDAGLSPAGLGEAGGQTFIASTVLLMTLTPFLAQAGRALERRFVKRRRRVASVAAGREGEASGIPHEMSRHVLILGYGHAARWLCQRLLERDVSVLVLTLSPTGAREAEAAGIPVIRGDYTKRFLLEEGSLEKARLVVVADDALATAERAVAVVRGTGLQVPVVTRTPLEEDAQALAALGTASSLSDQGLGRKALFETVMDRLGRPTLLDGDLAASTQPNEETLMKSFELSDRQRRSESCSHLDQARTVIPEAVDICPECVAAGDRWVHLRVCMTCGHVGCCDSSKNRHARGHAAGSGHCIVRSLEAGESWAWCFEDETLL